MGVDEMKSFTPFLFAFAAASAYHGPTRLISMNTSSPASMHSSTVWPWPAGAVQTNAACGFAASIASASVANVRMPSSFSTCARRSADRFTPTISNPSGRTCMRRILLRPIDPKPITTTFMSAIFLCY